MIEQLWSDLIEFTSQFVIPDWGALIALLPIFLAIPVFLYITWIVYRWATAGPTRRGKRRMEPKPPPGIQIRSFEPSKETEVLQMFEDAFMEFEGRTPSDLETWRAMTVRREGFTPEDMLVALDGERVVGGAFLIEADGGIWIDKFATHRDYRHRGVARAMLQTAFRRSWALGSPFSELNTDSRTGALSFYERIGMYIRSSYAHWTLEL